MGSLLRTFLLYGVVISVLLAVFLNFPAPELSDRLKNWKQRGQYFDFEGHKIFYIDNTGTGQGTVVCLHGFPTFSYDWIKILAGLEKRFARVVALDFLGFGFSDKPIAHNYSIFEQADIVEMLLLQLGEKSVHVLSHDYGDTVALELLARISGGLKVHLKTLCMLNGGIFKETHHPRLGQKLLRIPYAGAVLSRLTSYPVFKIGFGEVFGPKSKPSDEDFADFWAATRFNNGDKVAYKLIHFLNERARYQGRWVGALKSTNVPVHFTYGPADPVNPPAFVKHYSTTVPKPSITVLSNDIGHYPQWERPGLVLQDYNRFLDEILTKRQ